MPESQEKIIPADDRIFDEPPATLGDFLIFLLALNEFVVVAKGNGLGKFIRAFDLVKLLLDGLPECSLKV